MVSEEGPRESGGTLHIRPGQSPPGRIGPGKATHGPAVCNLDQGKVTKATKATSWPGQGGSAPKPLIGLEGDQDRQGDPRLCDQGAAEPAGPWQERADRTGRRGSYGPEPERTTGHGKRERSFS